MAFPATDLPDPSTWFSNALITSSLMKSNIIDAINLLPRGTIGEASSASSVTLSTTSNFAGLATVTYTLGSQRRVKITVQSQFNPATAVAGGYAVQAGYNTGSSAVIGSAVVVGKNLNIPDGDATTRSRGGLTVGTALLAAGQYTFYAVIGRTAGAATDTALNFYTLVEDIGNS